MAHDNEAASTSARDRAIAEMSRKGFELLAQDGDTALFYRLLGASAGAPAGLHAYFNGGQEGLMAEPVLGLAAVELVAVDEAQILHGVADSVRPRQSIEPLILLGGRVELALQTASYLGLARSDDEAAGQWGERVRARAEAEARLAAAGHPAER